MEGDKIDSGPIILQERIKIDENTKISDLVELAERIGAKLVVKAVEKFIYGNVTLINQGDEDASYCYPRLPRDGEINWKDSAKDIEKLIRSVGKPYPGAYSFLKRKLDMYKIKKMKIWEGHIEKHFLNEFYAVPGHIIKTKNQEIGVVTGDKNILVLDNIEIDGVNYDGQKHFLGLFGKD